MNRFDWRALVAALPLPMLALAASYGVYSFAGLFVPQWVALAQAAAFELVYIGLAVVRVADEQRNRARAISVGAVVVSIVYNTLAGLFHRQAGVLDALPLWGEIILAALHGAPLAWVAFLVSDLLLHSEPRSVVSGAHVASASEHIAAVRETPTFAPSHAAHDRTCKYCGESGLTAADIMAHGRARSRHGSCGDALRASAAD
jgi:hypothetical protein